MQGRCSLGDRDILLVDGVETMFMYFTVDSMKEYLETVASGQRLEPEGEFYPLGRLATMRSIHILYDRNGIMKEMQENLKEYPGQLRQKIIKNHFSRNLGWRKHRQSNPASDVF